MQVKVWVGRTVSDSRMTSESGVDFQDSSNLIFRLYVIICIVPEDGGKRGKRGIGNKKSIYQISGVAQQVLHVILDAPVHSVTKGRTFLEDFNLPHVFSGWTLPDHSFLGPSFQLITGPGKGWALTAVSAPFYFPV